MRSALSLKALQRNLQRHVLKGTAFEPKLIAGGRLQARRRLAVYSDGYHLRLAEALSETFPMLQKLIGASEFDALARAYAGSHPSRHYSLRYYGDRLDRYLAAHDPYRGYPVLRDMARFEWAMAAAFDADDALCLAPGELERLPPA